MSNAIKMVRVIQYELQYLIERRITALLLVGYALLALFISVFDMFREAYFYSFYFVILGLVNFILPLFLLINLVLVLSPMFAGEIENHIREIPSTSIYGRRIRCVYKLCATLIFIVLLNGAYHFITVLIGWGTQPLVVWSQLVIGVGGEVVFYFHWSAGTHYAFAVFSLLLASIVTAVLTLLISCLSKAAMTVCA